MLSSTGKADGKIFSADINSSGTSPHTAIALKSFPSNLGTYLKSFGQDQAGEVYVLTSDQLGPQGNTGKVWKLTP